MELIIFLLFLLIIITGLMAPVILTVLNFAGTFFLDEDEQQQKRLGTIRFKQRTVDILTIYIGLFLSAVLSGIAFLDVVNKDYNEAIHEGRLHNILNSNYASSVAIVLAAGIIGLTILCAVKPEKLSPIIASLSVAFTLLMLVMGIFLFVHTAINWNILCSGFCLYYFNLLLIAARRIKQYIDFHVRYNSEHETDYRFKPAAFLQKIMSSVSSVSLFFFIMILPAAAILEIIFILTGQGPDGFIKAFTMTADWTFSTQIPPPPLEYDGHYLCTVAAGGHKIIVTPLRYGKRLGSTIVVNRQLLAANAFEDLIMEKLPRFHRAVRSFYNKYGYPVSKLITTRLRADIVYILMKPLEYIFIFVLYLCDARPENRIAVQYSNYNEHKRRFE